MHNLFHELPTPRSYVNSILHIYFLHFSIPLKFSLCQRPREMFSKTEGNRLSKKETVRGRYFLRSPGSRGKMARDVGLAGRRRESTRVDVGRKRKRGSEGSSSRGTRERKSSKPRRQAGGCVLHSVQPAAAVSCRQIYRVARADPEQCRFMPSSPAVADFAEGKNYCRPLFIPETSLLPL